MKKIISCLLLIILSASPLLAVGAPALQAFLPETCYQVGHYEQQKSLRGVTKRVETQGTFAFACDKGLLWHTSSPLTETLVYQLQGGTHLVRADGTQQKLSGAVQRQLGQMLNKLLGGNTAYVEKNFTITPNDEGIRLTPRSKRMGKFLQRIDITRVNDAINIHLQHQADEYTAIRVHGIRTLPALDLGECIRQLAAEPPLGIACQQLFGH